MRNFVMSNKVLAVLILVFGSTMTCYAGYGGHFEYNGNFHPGYDNTYHQDDNLYHSDDAVVIGVPDSDINPTYPYSCPLVQQCYPNGNCVETQDCN